MRWPRRQTRLDHRTGLARALSKLGLCSRSRARDLITAGRVRVNGDLRRDPEWPVHLDRDHIEVDEQKVQAARKIYLMLNKPRGLVTTSKDEQGRGTVFECLKDAGLPFLGPVGRLDQASEGLLLFTNDSAWAARITAPSSQLDKVYHVQVNCLADEHLLRRMEIGLEVDGGFLAVKRARELRRGGRNCWLEVVLDEGKNRHLRRLLAGLGVEVLRLVRVSIGALRLGPLAKGQFRHLAQTEVASLDKRHFLSQPEPK
ncbi:MAG TPA: pseudouridine synthase [Candidatus Binatia bacterium]|jgi:23S rRNA pseudouridine2605 synthase|nr:pseudouridine synthase [Candidatus Binatia bacterium]